MEGGMPGVPEAVPSGGAPMPGGAPGAAPPPGPVAGFGTEGKILTRGKKSLKAPQESEVQPVGVPLTSLEQEMYKMLQSMEIPFQKWIQFPIGPYKADFAIPKLMLDIECDGQKWHATPDAKAHDKKRDSELANAGWTIVRFGEFEIKENQDAIKKTIIGYVYKLWQKALEQQKKQQEADKHRTASLERLLEAYGEKSDAPGKEVNSDGKADQGQGNNLEGELRGEVGVAKG
jgi:very-short-patch-repair endonuclease